MDEDTPVPPQGAGRARGRGRGLYQHPAPFHGPDHPGVSIN